MAFAQRVSSLREVGEIAAAGGEFRFAFCDFLDGFYARPDPAALAAEPTKLAGLIANGDRLDANLAAAAEHLSREHRWPVPSWTRDASRYLERPWFAMHSHGGRMVLLAESPAAFRVRNLFVGENALSRA